MKRRRSLRTRRRVVAQPKTVETKWGWGPSIDQGWCAVPASLLRCASGLGITAQEGWVLVQLLDLKWTEGRSAWSHLVERCHLDDESLHALLRSMEARGLLKLIPKPDPRKPTGAARADSSAAPPLTGWEIDLSPLIRVLNDYIMRGGDLSAGYLRFSSIRLDQDRSE